MFYTNIIVNRCRGRRPRRPAMMNYTPKSRLLSEKSYTKKGGIVMGKTVEYPAEFKLKAVQTYLEGNHGRI